MLFTTKPSLGAVCALAALLLIPAHPWAATARNQTPPATASSGNGKAAPPAGQAITLTDSINATLDQHRSLRAIQENRQVVEHERDRAERGYGPRVDVTGGAGVSVLSDATSRQYNESEKFNTLTRGSATLTQPIWDGWATRSRVRATQATLDSMTHRVFDNATTLALDSIIAHIDVLRCGELLEAARHNVDEHKRILGLTREREQAGADTMADVSKAESRLARAQTSLVDAMTALQDAQDTYTRLTGLTGYARLRPATPPPGVYANTQALMEEAKTTNPKLAAFLQDINAAKGQQQLAQASYYPTVNLEAGPSYTARGDKRDTWTYGFDVMGVARWNVFNSGADVAADKAAEARVRQARQTMYSLYDDIKLEAEKTWTALDAARQQLGYWQDAEKYNIITRQAYQEQFLMGQRSLLDLLDAENELYNSITQRITAQNNILIGGYRLLALSGVLLPRLHIPTEGLFVPPPPAAPDAREAWR